MNDEREKNPTICYVGFDDMGNILGACVHDDSNLERSALWVAGWILDGLHVKQMSVEDVRLNFGREVEGPDKKPTAPYHVRIITRDERGNVTAECEGDDDLLEDYDDDDDKTCLSGRDDLEPDEETKVYGEKAIEVLGVLFDGKDDWKRTRTLGDFDHLRLQVAGVLS